MHVTINQLKEWSACEDGFDRFMAGAGKDAANDEKVSLYDALDKGCKISDITWAISHLELTPDQERDVRLLACAFARRVLGHFEKEYPDDKRPRNAIDTAERFANGCATQKELYAAWAAARAAAWDATGDAAWDAAWDAARAAARSAAWDAAWDATGDARAAARTAEEQAQKELILKMLSKYK